MGKGPASAVLVQASEEYIKKRQQSIINGDIKGEAAAPEEWSRCVMVVVFCRKSDFKPLAGLRSQAKALHRS